MKRITEELITGIAQGAVTRTPTGEFRLTSPFGRTVDIGDKGIDFSQCLTPLLAGESEFNREETYFEVVSIADEIWDVIDVRRLPFFMSWQVAGYATAYGFTVDTNRCRPFGIAEAKAFFGEEANVKNAWFPAGWWIRCPNGDGVLIGLSGKDLTIEKVDGNVYERAMRFLANRQGYAVVCGPPQEKCLTAMAHGQALNIRVIPEMYMSFFAKCGLSTFISIVSFLLAGVVTQSFTDAIVAALVLPMIVGPIIAGAKKRAQKRGRALLNPFPAVHGGKRATDHEEARQKGWLA